MIGSRKSGGRGENVGVTVAEYLGRVHVGECIYERRKEKISCAPSPRVRTGIPSSGWGCIGGKVESIVARFHNS